VTEATELAALIDEARLGGDWVKVSIQDRAGLAQPEIIGRVAEAIGVAKPVVWHEVPIRTDGRRILVYAIGHAIPYRVRLMPPEKVEALVDRVIASVPGATTAYTNLGQFNHDFTSMTLNTLSDWPDGIALILVGPDIAGGIAIYGTD
jgi:hypothetical protein